MPDVSIWNGWLANALRLGLRDGYALNAHDYAPSTTSILWVAGPPGRVSAHHTVLKMIVSSFLLATTGVILAWTRRSIVAAL